MRVFVPHPAAGRSRGWLAVLAAAGVLFATWPVEARQSGAAAGAPTLDAILLRASRYVGLYFEEMSNLTAEEQYLQEATGPSVRLQTRSSRIRELRSDVVLVRIGPPLEWRPFRDVFEVDAARVRDRDDRLAALFLQPAESAHAQALRVSQESARFNIGNVARTLNQPGVPLAFLQTSLQPRFAFTLDRLDTDVGARVWIVKYKEQQRPTLFQHNSVMDNPSSGRFWINGDTGMVVRSEHVLMPAGLSATFTTSFGGNPGRPVVVPLEMTERVVGRMRGSDSVTGTARYSNFRRFRITTEESRTGDRPGNPPSSR